MQAIGILGVEREGASEKLDRFLVPAFARIDFRKVGAGFLSWGFGHHALKPLLAAFSLEAVDDGEFRAQAGPTVYKIDPYGVTAGLQVRFMLD